MSHGLDQVFPAPPHEIRGLTPVDQAWIDETIEAGSTCCRWQVKPRPVALDTPIVVPPAPKPKPKKTPLWRLLLKGRTS